MQNDQYLGAEKCIFDHIASLVSLLFSAPSRQKRKAKSNSTSDIDFETLTRRHVEWSSARHLFYSSEVTFCVIWKLWTHSHTQNTSHNPNRFICQANFSSFSTCRSRRDLYWRMIVKCGNRFLEGHISYSGNGQKSARIIFHTIQNTEDFWVLKIYSTQGVIFQEFSMLFEIFF